MSRIFGVVRQNGYVIRDMDAALQHWTDTLGIGPFFLFEHVPTTEFQYRGVPSAVDISIALANTGSLQIELIVQHNDAPTIYLDFLAAGNEGLHHVGAFTETFEADLRRLDGAGYTVAQSGCIAGGTSFAYYDTETHPGSVMEIIDVSGPTADMFQMIEDAAREWDGTEPIRRLGI